MEKIELGDLIFDLLSAKVDTDKALLEIDAAVSSIKDYYCPRKKFNRWRSSQAGKNWKKQKWESQYRCCAECKSKIPLLGSHIDHIKPLSKYPELAIDTQNLRVTCFSCNTSKGNQ